MNGMFANSRGLGDLAKHLHFAGCIQDHNLDFLAISETGRREFSQSLLNRLWGGIEFDWYSRPPHGRFGGILLGIRTDTMEVLEGGLDDDGLSSLYELKASGRKSKSNSNKSSRKRAKLSKSPKVSQ